MKWRKFLKPDKKKVILFILLFFLFPYPQMVCNGGCYWSFFPLGAPINFFVTIVYLIFGLELYTLFDFVMFFLGLFSPLLFYLLSCLIFFIYERLTDTKLKKRVKYILIGILGLAMVLIVTIVLSLMTAQIKRPTIQVKVIKVTMFQIQIKAGLIYSKNKKYSDLSCVYDEVMVGLCEVIEKRARTKPIIHAVEDKYCAYINLNDNEYYCIDNTGNRLTTAINPSNAGYCDGLTFSCPPGE